MSRLKRLKSRFPIRSRSSPIWLTKCGVRSRRTPFHFRCAGVDFDKFQPVSEISGRPIGKLADNEIVLNRWAAEDLQIQVGDTLVMTYFEPEAAHGREVEKEAEFVVRDIAALTRPKIRISSGAAQFNATGDLRQAADVGERSRFDAGSSRLDRCRFDCRLGFAL